MKMTAEVTAAEWYCATYGPPQSHPSPQRWGCHQEAWTYTCAFNRQEEVSWRLQGRQPRALGAKNKTEAIDRILSSTLIRPRQGRRGRGGEREKTKAKGGGAETGKEKAQRCKAKGGQAWKRLRWRKEGRNVQKLRERRGEEGEQEKGGREGSDTACGRGAGSQSHKKKLHLLYL